MAAEKIANFLFGEHSENQPSDLFSCGSEGSVDLGEIEEEDTTL